MQGFRFALVATIAFNTAIAALLTLVGYGSRFDHNLVVSNCIGLTVVIVVHLGWRLLWPGRRPPTVGLFLLVAVAAVTGWLGGGALASWLLGSPHGISHGGWATLAVTAAAGIVATGFFIARHRTAELERARVAAQLKFLQAQIEPHFLFNTLANLDALIATDPARAREMLRHFNDYLRAALAATRRDSGTLGEEFALLRDYLEVLAVRMGPRLTYELTLPPALASTPIPLMLLQPLVENAVKHGLEPKVDGGRVTVTAAATGGRLRLEVNDTGVGAAGDSTGVGLANVRERVAAAFGNRATVEAGATATGGFTVTLTLPL